MSNWTIVQHYAGKGGGPYLPYYDKPVIIITPRGEILITPCINEMMGYPTHVNILHDELKQQFALQPTTESESRMSSWQISFIRGGPNHHGKVEKEADPHHQIGRIRPTGFTHANGLTVDNNSVVLRAELSHDGLIVVDMKQKREIIPYRRRSYPSGRKSVK